MPRIGGLHPDGGAILRLHGACHGGASAQRQHRFSEPLHGIRPVTPEAPGKELCCFTTHDARFGGRRRQGGHEALRGAGTGVDRDNGERLGHSPTMGRRRTQKACSRRFVDHHEPGCFRRFFQDLSKHLATAGK